MLKIKCVAGQPKPAWLVDAYGMTLKFADQASAEIYASKLEERVNARHVLPLETQQHWITEHLRILRGS